MMDLLKSNDNADIPELDCFGAIASPEDPEWWWDGPPVAVEVHT